MPCSPANPANPCRSASQASQGNLPNPASRETLLLKGRRNSNPPCASPRRRKVVFPRKESHPTECHKMQCRKTVRHRMDSLQMERPLVRLPVLPVRLPIACRCRMPIPAFLPCPPLHQFRTHHPIPQRLLRGDE